MATATRCQTPGAVFHTIIEPHRIAVDVDFPFGIELSEAEAAVLDANLHNAVELVLAPYFRAAGEAA